MNSTCFRRERNNDLHGFAVLMNSLSFLIGPLFSKSWFSIRNFFCFRVFLLFFLKSLQWPPWKSTFSEYHWRYYIKTSLFFNPRVENSLAGILLWCSSSTSRVSLLSQACNPSNGLIYGDKYFNSFYHNVALSWQRKHTWETEKFFSNTRPVQLNNWTYMSSTQYAWLANVAENVEVCESKDMTWILAVD